MECCRVDGMVGVPDALTDFSQAGRHPFLAAGADLEEGMQEAFDDGDTREELAPGVLRRSPAVRVHRLWGIVWVQLLGFLLEVLIGFLQAVRIRPQRERSAQHAIGTHCGCDV